MSALAANAVLLAMCAGCNPELVERCLSSNDADGGTCPQAEVSEPCVDGGEREPDGGAELDTWGDFEIDTAVELTCGCSEPDCGIGAPCSSGQGLKCPCGRVCGEIIAPEFELPFPFVDHYLCYASCDPDLLGACGDGAKCFDTASAGGVCLRVGTVSAEPFRVKIVPEGLPPAITDMTAVNVIGDIGGERTEYVMASAQMVPDQGQGALVVISVNSQSYPEVNSLQIKIPAATLAAGTFHIGGPEGAEFWVEPLAMSQASSGRSWILDAIVPSGTMVIDYVPPLADCVGPECPTMLVRQLELELIGLQQGLGAL